MSKAYYHFRSTNRYPKPGTSKSADDAAFASSLMNQSPKRSCNLACQPNQLFSSKSGKNSKNVFNNK